MTGRTSFLKLPWTLFYPYPFAGSGGILIKPVFVWAKLIRQHRSLAVLATA
jgi:hypothetical protein